MTHLALLFASITAVFLLVQGPAQIFNIIVLSVLGLDMTGKITGLALVKPQLSCGQLFLVRFQISFV